MSISDDLGIRLVTDEEAERARAHIEALLADVGASHRPSEPRGPRSSSTPTCCPLRAA